MGAATGSRLNAMSTHYVHTVPWACSMLQHRVSSTHLAQVYGPKRLRQFEHAAAAAAEAAACCIT